ncbi:hypothetical protein [Streptomyces sp. NPDC059781]|uniref:hypothetical protein n=1 Tax=Streptomyces sp. NPDC059781 TaxID=3346943 RepID=UPI00366955B7
MSRLNDLASLDLRSLCEALAADSLASADLVAGEWLGVVELLTMRLADGCGELSEEHWGMCSAAIGHALRVAVSTGVMDRRESVIRRLNLANVLLQQVPPNSEVDMLNPDHLIDLLLREMPISVEEARVLSTDWRTLETSQIRLLRSVKNLVSPALALAGMVSREDLRKRLNPWGELLPLLP